MDLDGNNMDINIFSALWEEDTEVLHVSLHLSAVTVSAGTGNKLFKDRCKLALPFSFI